MAMAGSSGCEEAARCAWSRRATALASAVALITGTTAGPGGPNGCGRGARALRTTAATLVIRSPPGKGLGTTAGRGAVSASAGPFEPFRASLSRGAAGIGAGFGRCIAQTRGGHLATAPWIGTTRAAGIGPTSFLAAQGISSDGKGEAKAMNEVIRCVPKLRGNGVA